MQRLSRLGLKSSLGAAVTFIYMINHPGFTERLCNAVQLISGGINLSNLTNLTESDLSNV